MKNGNPFKAYITDLDGTLFDTLEANLISYKKAFEDAGIYFNAKLYRENFGLRFNEMIQILAPSIEPDKIEIIKQKKAIYYKKNINLIKPNILILDLLEKARHNNIKTALVTTAREKNAMTILNHFESDRLFNILIFGEQVSKSKPDPECYKLAITSLSVKSNECLVFEDTNIGVEAARSAGAHVLKVII